MSLRSYETSDGTRWQVQWRDAQKKLRGRSFTSKKEALAFDADIKARKFTGQGLPKPGKESLATAYDEWWDLRGSQLAPATRRVYRGSWNTHVRDRFDGHTLNELANDPQLFEELVADMRDRGAGPAAQRKVLVVISAVLTAAVEWNKIGANPLWRMRKPPATPQRHPHPLPPLVIERMRLRLQRRETRSGPDGVRGEQDSIFVQLMAYAGLRPGEALALTWGDVRKKNLAIDKSVRDGALGPTKTGGMRSVPMVEPLAGGLYYLRERLKAGNRELVFPGHDGNPWSQSAANNWRARVFKPTLEDLAASDPPQPELADVRPYDCRGSFVSLQLRAGVSPLEVAQWAGHSPAVMFRHYANVIDELRGQPILSANEQIWRARHLVMDWKPKSLDEAMAEVLENPDGNALGGLVPIPEIQHHRGAKAALLYGEHDLLPVPTATDDPDAD